MGALTAGARGRGCHRS